MTNEKKGLGTFKTIALFTAIGMMAAYIIMYVSENPIQLNHKAVTFNEISSDDAKELAESFANTDRVTASYSNAVETAAPAVVNIFTAKRVKDDPAQLSSDPLLKHFFGDRLPIPQERLETSLGSGVIISNQGYILTNNHVIEKAEEIQVALRDGRNAQAKVVGTDPESDLAVLKIKLNDLPTITLGHSDVLRVGDVVLAIGNPFGVGQTVTMGIISATGRDRLGLSTFEDFIQTDAAINPGNSGGALVNAFGHLVGINTAIFSQSGGSQGIGFAIPINNAKLITAQIIEHGHVVRGWIGVEIQNMTPELAESFNLDSVRGVIVAGVLRNGPADTAGLKPGDIILEINGMPVSDGTAAVKRIAKAAPGTPVELQFLRSGKRKNLSVITTERPVPGNSK